VILTAQASKTSMVLGVVNLALVAMYASGLMGNHYVEVYSKLVNMVSLLILASLGNWAALAQTLVLLWMPIMTYLTVVLSAADLSAISPGKLYLGIVKAAAIPDLLKQHKITHVLELTNGRKSNDPSDVKAELPQLTVTDDLGSQGSFLSAVMEEAIKSIKYISSFPTILVHGSAGVSRSPALVLYYLARQMPR
jgi:hypothetical protein